ncbi:NADH dehydrogenase (quinone) [Desulfurobacterium thermolithotrophum DSM 11699]|uniref:NADH-quinone oxidoreductase subunit H n=1 Tax=Desulfurobacterium thermolithotrophum (strain DSM 11699 / BSA) TaxID=868864 RepID=F0S0L9_DESTD|nr:complex I subunit 1 family protein [Desulfurobacterium thermolithotrophum]ADY73822.1 NADH dehydrogenase (quinone) [Desulfurobacterium thermolithotrophum DSM 11699]
MEPWFKAIVFPGFLFLLIVFLLIFYLERKILADVHLRTGPYYVGKWGLLQTTADVFKLLQKEFIIQRRANKLLYSLIPFVAFLMVTIIIAFIPFSKSSYVVSTSFDLLIVLAIVTSMPPIFFYAGWASKSKYSFIGGLRVVNQMISSEIPIWLSALAAAVFYGTLNHIEIVEKSSWLSFLVLLPAFFIFTVATLIVTDRPPFDIPEAEQEIVYGFLTEYGGFNYALLILSKLIELFGLYALAVTLFLGGFKGPFLPGIFWFLLKILVLYFFTFVLRASTPRIRMDQLLRFCWQILTPFALLNLIFIIFVKMLLS